MPPGSRSGDLRSSPTPGGRWRRPKWCVSVPPASLPSLERSFFHAHFVEGRSLADPGVLDSLVTASGADAELVRTEVEAGAGRGAVDASMESAWDLGITATPTWLLAGMVMVRGAQPRTVFEQAVARARQRAGGATD